MKRNLLLGASVTVIFFCLLEAGLRLSGKVATDALRSPDLQTLDRIPGLFEPNKRFVDRIRPDLPYGVSISASGFRGHGFEARKPAGTLRVLCLGDSYTFGHHVEDDETFPAVLERTLRPRHPQIEVINAGVNGFTIVDEFTLLKTKAMSLDPDIVILVFSQNDILDLARPRQMIDLMREHARLKSIFLLGPSLKVLQHTAVFNAMQRFAALLKGTQRETLASTLDEREPALWGTYREYLEAFQKLATGHGARMFLVAWPSAHQIPGEAPVAPNSKLAGFARDLDISFLDLTGPLRELQRSGVNPSLMPLDGHPSAAGQRAAALAIAGELEDVGYLQAATVPVASRP